MASKQHPLKARKALKLSSRAATLAFRTPNRLWMGIFGIWGVLLTGFTWGFTGSPGFIQQYRLNTIFETKQSDLAMLEAEVETLNHESERLEKSTFAQEREVRKTLGYVAPDEMIFDFSASPFSFQSSEALLSVRVQQQKKGKGAPHRVKL